MGLDAHIVYEQLEMQEHYYYDLGYHEGVRNILQIIHKNLLMKELPEIERVELLLKEVGDELDDARKLHLRSEKIYEEFEGY